MSEETTVVTEKEKRNKKLSKSIEGTIVTIKESVSGEILTFDFAALPKNIQENFGPFGLGHKLGDAAAGKEGAVAVDSIKKVWDGLVKGDWSVRAPAAEKISKKEVAQKFAALDDKMKALLAKNPDTKAMLESLGVKF